MKPRQIPVFSRMIDTAQIDNLENIARSINSYNLDSYRESFAQEIARQKIQSAGIPYDDDSGFFDYLLEPLNGIGVIVSSGPIVPDTRSFYVQKYAQKIKKQLNDHSGVIFMLPIQMNGRVVLKLLENELDCGFVNLAYDAKSLERRFFSYGKK